jgi:hypothetical protein
MKAILFSELFARSRKVLPLMFTSIAAFVVQVHAGNGKPTLIGWNNLGMHCMDDDYSVFSILPPFNTIDVQLIDANGRLVTNPAGFSVTYEAVADPDGSFNTSSIGKSNFWDHALDLFGASLLPDVGLTGLKMPGATNQPQSIPFNSAMGAFEGAGIPICPKDDQGRKNTYPMMKLTARSSAGSVLATTDIVLPVSDEMDCRACHASTAGPAAKPALGWANDPNDKRDFRLNILRLHDQLNASNPLMSSALASNAYNSAGLEATAVAGTAILCARCHTSEALPGSGVSGIKRLTTAMHSRHANVVAPLNGLALDAVNNRSSCYQCHPGSATRCLRGAMGAAVATDGTMEMQCQSCHGGMSTVGASTRLGWVDEPQCGNCHSGTATDNSGLIRFLTAFDANGSLRTPKNTTFATNADTPAAGLSLYRFSKGHGGLQCSACHGSTHAEFPSSHRNDNLQSWRLQGHVGVLADCTTCHKTMPNTINGGPHGMHPIGASWVGSHGDAIERGGWSSCTTCHGTDLRGTVLSRAQGDRTFATEMGTKKFARGMEIGCYSCHNGPRDEDHSGPAAPAVAKAKLQVSASGSASLTLKAALAGAKVRIVQQPMHGTVALNGLVATYRPDQGFIGPDFFTYLASDGGGMVDSLPATISVNVGTVTATLDSDGDGIPDLLEYALGLSPQFPSPERRPVKSFDVISGKYYQTISTVRSITPPDAPLLFQVSGNNKTWTNATKVTDTPELLKYRDPAASTASKPRSIRITVNRP